MKAMAPLKKTIVVETSVARMQDSELIQNLAIGGVKWVTVGVETLSAKLKKHGAGTLKDNLKEIIQCAHDCGIAVQGNFICGLTVTDPNLSIGFLTVIRKRKLILHAEHPGALPQHRAQKPMQNEGRILIPIGSITITAMWFISQNK